MGRLIDVDVLMTDVRNTITEKSGAMDWINLINCQLTAYDPDKVVEQLEALPQCSTWNHNSDNVSRQSAIEIVKGGGVDA